MAATVGLPILILLCGAVLGQAVVKLAYPDLIDCSNHTRINNPSMSLNTTLTAFLSSPSNDTVLRLTEAGCYTLSGFFLITGASNFTLTGSGVASEYVITCTTGNGLTFFDVTALHLKNLTINGCGISNQHIEEVVELVQNHIDLFFRVPHKIQYGLIIADCSNVTVEDVAITNTQGLGLLAINIIGVSSFREVEFTENHAPLCLFESLSNLTSDQAIGGGMFLLYHNYWNNEDIKSVQLTMSCVTFYSNSYCSSINSISALYGQSVTANAFGYVVGSAAAMGITLAQLEYAVDIVIESSIFTNNTGLVGAGVHVGIFQNVKNSDVTFIDCTFTKNGLDDYSNLPFGLHSQSAGLYIFNNLQFPNETLQDHCSSRLADNPVAVNVINALFSENQAYACAAFQISSFQSTHGTRQKQNYFLIVNSTFTNNQGSAGPVACAITSEASGVYPSFQLTFHDVTVANNSVQSSNTGILNHLVESSGQILLVSVNFTITGLSMFANNSGVVIVAVTSLVNINGDVHFIGNKGVFGGAIRIYPQSYLIIKKNANLSFINNQATVEGGAIFFSTSSFADSNPLVQGDCFLYFNYVDVLCNYSMCPDIASMNFHVSFIGNTAHQGGTIYGSTLNSCPWYNSLSKSIPNSNTTSTALQLLSLLDGKFHFDPPLVNASVLSTNSATLKLAKTSKLFSTNPGGRISLQISAYDAFGFRTSIALGSSSENPSLVNTRLGNSVYYFISSTDTNGTIVPLDVSGYQNQSASVELFSVDSGVQSIIGVATKPCGPGFVYNYTSLVCECIANLVKNGVICNTRNETLLIPDNHWFGYLVEGDKHILVYSTCFYDYCKPSYIVVSVLDLDYQCNSGYNRVGLACGVCRNGTSAVFGTSRCEKCSNTGLFWILGLAVAGIIMIFGISFLGFTITEGYLNGFIFYCNALNYFFVYLSPRYPFDSIFSPAAWVNLGLGIESCFYDGMTTLARIGLRFVFPLYLFILMGIIVLLAKKVSKFASLRFSASKTFATLILLCYFSILGTCVEVMAFTRYTGLYGNVSYIRWNLDPSRPYGHGLHGILIVISLVLLLVYIIPFPLLFLFPKFLYSSRFTNKFKPIYDAFWNPFKPNIRFWLSIRAMLLFIPFGLALFGSYPTNVLGMVVFVPLVWFIHERIAPFVGYWQNAFDSFFLLNLMILFIGNIFYERYRDEQFNYPEAYAVLVYTLVCSAYLAFLIILVIHVFIRFPNLKTRLTSICNRKKYHLLVSKTTVSNATSSEEIPNVTDKAPCAVNYSEFREPLIDEYGTITLDTRTDLQ